jgi:hypothetical protein
VKKCTKCDEFFWGFALAMTFRDFMTSCQLQHMVGDPSLCEGVWWCHKEKGAKFAARVDPWCR